LLSKVDFAMTDPCPLCQIREVKPKLRLYETPVCKKCYYGFANRRQFAYLIDIILLQILSSGLGALIGIVAQMIAGAQMSEEELQLLTLGSMVFGFVLSIGYGIKDGFGGKSLGKLICRVTCMKEETYRPAGLWDSFVRNLLLNIPLFILVVLLRMNKGHRPGDGWAKTRVVWDKYQDNPVFNPKKDFPTPAVDGFGDGTSFAEPIDESNPYAPPRAR
jgi:uncharacterized RDD family membrane protein YckC